ncbi:DUF1287 domain-containing protein [Bacteroides sp. 224]|uniref:DUF1287 domain-containing protein n=1 Tax=Bacteroides sp. 224 TaxID=2302936 RepID=UPI0013D08035|nr:DUF1287 domain-containing protein [Bacteroides sp. 224]NDV64438.1 DUF1287 domain-containing protein [Bacteroides sp. 224]
MRKRLSVLLIFGWVFVFNLVAQEDFYSRLADAAMKIVNPNVVYDPAYTRISYPNGDVASSKGVCTDVIIRTYRLENIDLQKEVHTDMRANFSLYPKIWGLKKPDTNIDHRRVPNLMTFFSRKGTILPMSEKGEDYNPGDVVCWRLSNGMTHIGLVVKEKNAAGNRYKVIHNIGYGQVVEDCLFSFKIIGHYKYKK